MSSGTTFSRKCLGHCHMVFLLFFFGVLHRIMLIPAWFERSRGLVIQMQNISLWSGGMCRKQNFKIVFGFKSDTTVLTFTFHFLCFPFFCFSCPIFYSCFFLLVDFILVGKVFRKAFRILELDEMKGRWVVEQHFHGNV